MVHNKISVFIRCSCVILIIHDNCQWNCSFYTRQKIYERNKARKSLQCYFDGYFKKKINKTSLPLEAIFSTVLIARSFTALCGLFLFLAQFHFKHVAHFVARRTFRFHWQLRSCSVTARLVSFMLVYGTFKCWKNVGKLSKSSNRVHKAQLRFAQTFDIQFWFYLIHLNSK